VNLWAFWTFKPIPIPENPTLRPSDVTVILPTLDGEGEELERTIASILQNKPKEIILVTIDENMHKAERTMNKMPASIYKRIRCMSVKQANKRRQMARAIPEVTTEIIVFADDDVTWPVRTLQWMLAPFEDKKYGGVVTCQRLRRAENPTFSQRIYGFLGALYLERRNFDCAATTHMDGGVPCLSGRTCAYRTSILQDVKFTNGFTNEKWWFGQYQLNADDDNFLTRWMVSHHHETYMQYHPECEVLTTLEDNPNFLKQCLRWARSNWRSNITSMFTERDIWR
jgi:cellulose synthase/poly-beta-1,6-N-acetylglucosamine synthase-like glycosyltransferase